MKRLIRIAFAVILLLTGFIIGQAIHDFAGSSSIVAVGAIGVVIGLGLIARKVLR